MKKLLMFALLVSYSSIVLCQTISTEISKEQKEEIVKTLIAYPLLLDEVNEYEQLLFVIKKNLSKEKERNNLLQSTNKIQNSIIIKEREKFLTLENGNSLLKKQLKSSRLKTLKVTVVAAVIISVLIIK